LQPSVILVDEHDRQTGIMDKMEVHEKGLLHRAFSIFIFNSKGEMLLQQRAAGKYHSPLLWTNTCCSHPLPGEEVQDAATRRLEEEMGFQTPLRKAFSFIYQTSFDNGLTEHEFDHVFVGTYDGLVSPDAAEVAHYNYVKPDLIEANIAAHPQHYTEWFKIAFPKLSTYLTTSE
jgi:isopentenyl-diphosphate delta-isomerase